MKEEINDVLINKVASIEKCIARAKQEYGLAEDFKNDFSRQDAAILNISRACEQVIDIANYVVRIMNLKVPNNSSDSFELLLENKIINENICEKMKKMIGFRNIAIHEYQKINIKIVESIIKNEINDLLNFAEIILIQKKKIKILGMIRKIRFDNSRKENEFEIQEIREAMVAVYQYYNTTKDKVSDYLKEWRRHKLIQAASGYNSKFYRVCVSALELFFTEENMVSKSNKYDLSKKISDKDFEEYFIDIK